jgi:hypothetical protein
MYTWGYIKECTLNKLNLSEAEANQQNFLSNFPYYANEAMTQICSAVRPNETFAEFVIEEDDVNKLMTMPELFVGFSDDVVTLIRDGEELTDVGDEYLKYYGYNQIAFKTKGIYYVPYKARWFFFTKDLHNDTIITAPADICEAIPSYIASQCLKIDDETKAAVFRNEFEMFVARIDDTSFKSQRTFHIGGGW